MLISTKHIVILVCTIFIAGLVVQAQHYSTRLDNEYHEPYVYATKTPSVPLLQGQLKEICRCESGGRHWRSDGTVLRGYVDNDDIGLCQINARYHQATAESMGLEIYSYQGNVEYAIYLYETQGTQPWIKSVGCWGHTI